MSRRNVLGTQALELIRDTGQVCRELDRNALRQRVEEASQRPAPGMNSALQTSLGDVLAAGNHFEGAWDATGLLPVHLLLNGKGKAKTKT